jgi:hypothetical protein
METIQNGNNIAATKMLKRTTLDFNAILVCLALWG